MKARDEAKTQEKNAAAGEKKKTSRRGFTKSVAAALAAAPVALTNAAAQQRPAEPKAPPNPQPNPSPTPAAAQQQQQPPSPVAESYAAVARARFGAHLSTEEFERVKRDLGGNVRAADALSKAKLANADEPDFVFEA